MFNSSSVAATDGSIAVAGDVYAPITLTVQQTTRLSSTLGKVITAFADMSEAQAYISNPVNLPPKIDTKISFNKIVDQLHLLERYKNYAFLLDLCWQQVSEVKSAARTLTLDSLQHAYKVKVTQFKKIHSTLLGYDGNVKQQFADQILGELFSEFSEQLFLEFSTNKVQILVEDVQFAVGLVLIDAFVECKILERPTNNVTT